MQVLESDVERRFVNFLEKYGVMHAKLNLQGRRGWPDRIVILPHGRVLFVELKRPGEELQPLQRHIHEQLRDQGQLVVTVDDPVKAFNFVKDQYLYAYAKV